MAFGDFSDFTDDYTTTGFIIFAFFSFFVTLIMMNLLIAIMSDSYERVQANSLAADARILASLILEMEEIYNYLQLDEEVKI